MADTSSNGARSLNDGIIAQLRGALSDARDLLEEHDQVRGELVAQVKRYEKALVALLGESAPAKQQQQRVRPVPAKVGPERLSEVGEWVREYGREHEEFRQVDLRSAHGKFSDGGTFSSAIAAQAFEQLRQSNVLRIARVDGNSKWYRLTRSAVRAS